MMISRRAFVSRSSLAMTGVALGCSEGAVSDLPPSPTDSGRPDAGPSVQPPARLAWEPIPPLRFVVGVQVNLDLRSFLLDPTGGAASIRLDGTLPAGLAFESGMIRGAAAEEAPPMDFRATADDGRTSVESQPFTLEVEPASGVVSLEFDRRTPEHIAMHLPHEVSLPEDAMATVRYRPAGERAWIDAHPLLRIRPEFVTGGAPREVVDAFAGTIFDLTPGASYDVEIMISIAGSEPVVLQSTVTTRALPSQSGAPTMSVSASDNLQDALNALGPGDVLELQNGIYDVDGLRIEASGMEGMPVVIRGESREGVVLRNRSRVIQILESSHLTIENLTLEGSGVDSGTDASSHGISFWNGGAEQEEVTLRGLDIVGVDRGVIASGAVRGLLVYDCVLRGNNTWTQDLIESNATWNDDGIRIPGEGNCAFDNTLSGFGDACAVTNGEFSAAVYFYRNAIEMTGDDACEGDFMTRNFGFYDNYISNCGTFLSLDPLWGGPLYCFRNVVINTMRGPFKLNNENTGFMIYNNTIVRTDGRSEWAWAQSNNGALRNWSYRNNLMVYLGDGRLLALESSGNDPIDFTHNGWSVDRAVWWTRSGGSFRSLEEARAALPETTPVFGTATRRHDRDIFVESNPFDAPISLGPDHLTEVTERFDFTLRSDSVAHGAGTPIPNVTDGFSGEAPSIGAHIPGRSFPVFGARR
ncbi:MAG: putative Ig domain-containing protein [Myxococcota bacterium]